MDHREVGRYWEMNAEAWTQLARAGYDVCRDKVNTPAFLAMLPEVDGRRGLDIGCGEGGNTRAVARRGARMIGIDIAPTFIAHAQEAERAEPLGIEYRLASAVDLPFAASTFDFATAFMCLMDIPEYERAIAEAWRVLVPGGFLQFSILHPCFGAAGRRVVPGEAGRPHALEMGDYFEPSEYVEEWIFGALPPEERARWADFKVPYFAHTLSDWLNTLAATGFRIEQTCEPRSTEADAAGHANLAGTRIFPLFFQVRVRKDA